MKVVGKKQEKIKQQDQKSDQTTAINSRTHSRKNSSFLGLSKGSQTIILLSDRTFFGPGTKRNKKCLNITVNNLKSTQPKNQRAHDKKQNISFLNFNFCQQVQNKENFYTQIIDVQKAHQVLKVSQKIVNIKRLRAISLGKVNSTLNSPKSPINQLIKLLDQNDNCSKKEIEKNQENS